MRISDWSSDVCSSDLKAAAKRQFCHVRTPMPSKPVPHVPETGSTLPAIMDIVPLLLARIQFTASLSFLALFMALALALSWLLLFFKLRSHRTGLPGWTAASRFWVRIFPLSRTDERRG